MEKGEPRFIWVPCYDRSSTTRSRTDRVYTDIKIANNTKISHIMVFFIGHYNFIYFVLIDSLQKLKLEKLNSTLIILFNIDPSSPQLQRMCFFIKIQRNYLASDWREYTNSCFKDNARKFSKNSTNSRKY